MSTRQTPKLALVVGQHRVARGQLLEDDLLDLEPAAADALSMFCEAFTAQ